MRGMDAHQVVGGILAALDVANVAHVDVNTPVKYSPVKFKQKSFTKIILLQYFPLFYPSTILLSSLTPSTVSVKG
jgi:hypothetical protein